MAGVELGLRVLVVNAGSSSLKVSLVAPDDTVLAEHDFQAPGGQIDSAGLAAAVHEMRDVEAIGHRVVHGGPRYPQSVRIDAEVIRYLVSMTDLAPLHLPAALAGVAAVREVLPRVPAVAAMDTAFHSRMPAAASTYAIPHEWREQYGVRRYGFHGFSHAYAARRAAEIVGSPGTGLKVVTCHLGSGASLAAVWGGRSMDATTLEALAGTGDMKDLLEMRSAGDEGAQLAFDVYIHRLRGCIAAMAAGMGGVDVLVFTGGVGEHAAPLRAATVSGLRFLGVEIEPTLNANVNADADISSESAAVPTLVIKAREDIEVAREVRKVLAAIPR